MKIINKKFIKYKTWGNPGSYYYIDTKFRLQDQELLICKSSILLSNYKDHRLGGIQIYITI